MQPKPKRDHSVTHSVCFKEINLSFKFAKSAIPVRMCFAVYMSVCVCAVCVFHLKDACSSGNTFQYAGLVTVLEEDGSVVINVLHLDEHGSRACPSAASRTVVYVQKQTRLHQFQG